MTALIAFVYIFVQQLLLSFTLPPQVIIHQFHLFHTFRPLAFLLPRVVHNIFSQILTYGYEAWIIDEMEESKIRAAEMQFSRSVKNCTGRDHIGMNIH